MSEELTEEIGRVTGKHYGETGDAEAVLDALNEVAQRYERLADLEATA
jgi:glyoxylate carboligase